MERLDQGHLRPKLEVPGLTYPAKESTPASPVRGKHSKKAPLRKLVNIYSKKLILKGHYFEFFSFYVQYSTLLHLPPLKFHCVGGCWDRTQELRPRHWLPDAPTTRLDLIHSRPDLIYTRLDLIHSRLNLIHTRLDLIHSRLELIHIF